MSVHQRFSEMLKELKSNPTKLAKAIKITPPTIHSIVSGSSLPSAKVLMPLIEVYPSVNLNWLLSGKGKMFLLEDSTPVKNKDLDQLRKIIASLELSNESSRKRGETMDKYILMLEKRIEELEGKEA